MSNYFSAADLEGALERNDDLQDLWWEVEYLFRNGQNVVVNGEPVFVKLVKYNEGYDEDYTDNYKRNIEIILSADGRLFRKTGYHQSFTGGNFDGPFEEVKAVEKKVITFERV